jgi:hypothetical protein
MLPSTLQLRIVRVLWAGAFLAGSIGLVAGLLNRSFRLGTLNWFWGGSLLAFLAIALLLDAYVEVRLRQESSTSKSGS